MLIDNYQQFVGLENLGTANILPGDILVKKIFSETAKTIVERAITAAQRLLKKPEEVKVSNGLFSKKETFRFENRGSSTAEHAAIVINKGLMAEAVRKWRDSGHHSKSCARAVYRVSLHKL